MNDFVSVRTKPGRVARNGPTGQFIPDNAFVSVLRTPYIERLINVHKDLIVQPEPKAEQTPVKLPEKQPDKMPATKMTAETPVTKVTAPPAKPMPPVAKD